MIAEIIKHSSNNFFIFFYFMQRAATDESSGDFLFVKILIAFSAMLQFSQQSKSSCQ